MNLTTTNEPVGLCIKGRCFNKWTGLSIRDKRVAVNLKYQSIFMKFGKNHIHLLPELNYLWKKFLKLYAVLYAISKVKTFDMIVVNWNYDVPL